MTCWTLWDHSENLLDIILAGRALDTFVLQTLVEGKGVSLLYSWLQVDHCILRCKICI